MGNFQQYYPDDPRIIIEAFNAGKEGALLEVLKRYGANLTYTAFGIVKDQQESEDIVNDAFQKAWEKRGCFESLQKLKAYMYVVVKHACFHYLDKQKATRNALIEYKYLCDDIEEDLLAKKTTNETILEIREQIHKLPQKSKKLMLDIYDDGLSTKKLAEIYDTPAQHIRVNKSRSISQLKSLCVHIKR